MTKEEKINILNEYYDDSIKNLVPFVKTGNNHYLEVNDEVFEKIKTYSDEWYVINSKKNVIKYTCTKQLREPIIIIVEWTNNKDGKLIYCTFTEDLDEDNYIETAIDERNIHILTDILNIFKFFKSPYVSVQNDNSDDITMRLEVQIDNKFEEVIDVSPSSGVIYEMGKKLFKYSSAKLKDRIFD